MTDLPVSSTDIVIAGGGLAGLTAAVALRNAGLAVLVAAPQGPPDARTTALLADSIDFLDGLGLGDKVRDLGVPLRTMRLIDDTGRLIRAPETVFESSEIGLECFGYNIPNAALGTVLREAAQAAGAKVLEASVEALPTRADSCEVVLAGGESVRCQAVIGADGRSSTVRSLAGIGERRWSYPQTAIVLDFEHTLPHGGTSTEFHTTSGPFTIVPVGKRRCGLVWVETPADAARLVELPEDRMAREVERRMHSILGTVRIAGPVQTFPLSGMLATRFGIGRVALVGEAAHVFPPIGAQGFNLAMRDIRGAIRAVATGAFADFGDRYHRLRAVDIASRSASVDLLNRSLLTGMLPVQIARGAGLAILGSFGPLRRLAMRQGLAPGYQFRSPLELLSRRESGQNRNRPNSTR